MANESSGIVSTIIVLVVLLLGPAIMMARPASAQASTGTTRPVDAEIIIRTPTMKSIDEAQQIVEAAAEAGITAISIAFKDDDTGLLLYNSSLPHTQVYPGQEEASLIRQVIETAHSRGLKVYAWVPMFNDPILATEQPDLRMVRRVNGKLTPSSQFVSPVRPEVREHQLSLLSEIASEYPVDGIRIDWVRFDIMDEDLSDYARQAFQAEHGADPANLRRVDDLWSAWVAWRGNIITSFVADVMHRVPKAAGRELDMGAYLLPFSVIQGLPGAPESGQDYEALAETGIALMPMVYWQDWAPRATWEGWTERVLVQTLRAAQGATVIPVYSVTNHAWGQRLEHVENVNIVRRAVEIARSHGVDRFSFFYYSAWWDGLIQLYLANLQKL